MKKIKAVNGYTIFEATARDEKKYNVTEGAFYLYFSSDVRDFGLSNSEWDWEAGSIAEAEDFATGSNYAAAKEIVEECTTAATFEEIEAVEKTLDRGEDLIFAEYLKTVGDVDTELIIAGCEMPASFVWDINNCFTEYGKTRYAPILGARCKVYPGCVEIFCDDENLGIDFVWTVAGYTSDERYSMIIKEV